MTILTAASTLQPTIKTEEQRACCDYVQSVVEASYGLPTAEGDLLALWRIFDAEKGLWGPVEAVRRLGIGESFTGAADGTPPVPTIGRWSVCQGWRGKPGTPGATGHTWLWRALDSTYGIRLDSATSQFRGPPGPELHGLVRWVDQIAPFHLGVAVASLRPPAR